MAQMHDVSDPRNASILINVNGELKARAEAVISVFDSGFMLGDGVIPSNTKAGYLARLVIRRAIRLKTELQIHARLAELVDEVTVAAG